MVVVDTRSNDAFNSWKLDGVTRGGHIKSATDFSALWLNVKDDMSGHIKESIHINTDEVESAPLWSINKDSNL